MASITEQNSLEILESSLDNDHVTETPPQRLAKPTSTVPDYYYYYYYYYIIIIIIIIAVIIKTTSTVPDVVYDEYGQTWDVYGAEFDPAILGQAIQAHLYRY